MITDLDGTLLDHDTYSYEAARPALRRLNELGVPLVIVTSKTAAEVAGLRRGMGVGGVDITENGARSSSSPALCDALIQASRQAGVQVRGFHQMTDEDVAAASGLPLEIARLARRRQHAEPFLITASDGAERLLAAIDKLGLRWTRGGRFHHLFEQGGKGPAISRLLQHYPDARSLGLGDAPSDLEMLQVVEDPVIVSSAHLPTMRRVLPRALVAQGLGHVGWNHAVNSWLDR